MASPRDITQREEVNGGNEVALERLRQRFTRFRNANPPGTRVPETLRRDAVAALNAGVPSRQLRSACGISHEQLKYWQRGARKSSRADTSPSGRIFSVVDDAPSVTPTSGIEQREQELELRFGGWSISVRRG